MKIVNLGIIKNGCKVIVDGYCKAKTLKGVVSAINSIKEVTDKIPDVESAKVAITEWDCVTDGETSGWWSLCVEESSEFGTYFCYRFCV